MILRRSDRTVGRSYRFVSSSASVSSFWRTLSCHRSSFPIRLSLESLELQQTTGDSHPTPGTIPGPSRAACGSPARPWPRGLAVPCASSPRHAASRTGDPSSLALLLPFAASLRAEGLAPFGRHRAKPESRSTQGPRVLLSPRYASHRAARTRLRPWLQ